MAFAPIPHHRGHDPGGSGDVVKVKVRIHAKFPVTRPRPFCTGPRRPQFRA
jgi:hypothetical protein